MNAQTILRPVGILAALLVAITASLASATTSRADSLITVSGRVVTASGDPVSGLDLIWGNASNGYAEVTTDSTGAFTLADIVSGPAYLALRNPPDDEDRQTSQFPGRFQVVADVSFVADQDGLVLRLPEMNAVQVTVTGTDGTPVANASVSTMPVGDDYEATCPAGYVLTPDEIDASCRQELGNGAATTDANGHATVLLVKNPQVTTTLQAADPVNTARAAVSAPFTTDTTQPVTITLPSRPGAPEQAQASVEEDSATVTWDPPSDDGGSDITSYTVTATPDEGDTPAVTRGGASRFNITQVAHVVQTQALDPVTVTTDGTTTIATLNGLVQGTRYTITVQATNAIGTGPAATTEVLVPLPKPTRLELSPATSTIIAGHSQSFLAEGFDAKGNDLGDVTNDTVFSISPSGSCDAATCTASTSGSYEVTGTDGAATGSATIQVTKVNQTITFAPLTTRTLIQSPVLLTATASSSLPVAFVSSTPSICTSSGLQGRRITLVAPGTCKVWATQAGNGTFNAATAVLRSFAVTKAGQTITFAALSTKTLSQSPVYLSATASSGLAVAFTSTTPSVCTSAGIQGRRITLLAPGTCTVKATQPGNSVYNAAPSVTRSFVVKR